MGVLPVQGGKASRPPSTPAWPFTCQTQTSTCDFTGKKNSQLQRRREERKKEKKPSILPNPSIVRLCKQALRSMVLLRLPGPGMASYQSRCCHLLCRDAKIQASEEVCLAGVQTTSHLSAAGQCHMSWGPSLLEYHC